MGLFLGLIQIGCPVTCFVNPFTDDYLTTDDSVRVNGVLLDYSLEGLNGVLPNYAMPCTLSYYRSDYQDYLSEGVGEESCDTTSNDVGIFDLDLGLSSPGLYRLSFLSPVGDIRTHLVTSRPDLEAQDDEWVYLDWNYEEGGGGVNDSLQDTIDSTLSLSDPSEVTSSLVGAELVKLEVERVLQSYFNYLRIYIWNLSREGETPGADVQVVQMETCGGEIDEETCCGAGDVGTAQCNNNYSAGNSSVDYKNDRAEESPVHIRVPVLSHRLKKLHTPGGYLSSEDRLEVRVGDIARNMAVTLAHELGHSFGLVKSNYLFGSYDYDYAPSYGEHHTPYEPPFVGSVRAFPGEVMSYRMWGNYVGQQVDDCNPVPRPERVDETLIERCPRRFNTFNWQYLDFIQ
ncbi:MAG: hypothetical protein HYT77_09440 [Deltaproteobacteria bacterium]|nr:hypothetical protein [Deltaproteobacteria bacterium]